MMTWVDLFLSITLSLSLSPDHLFELLEVISLATQSQTLLHLSACLPILSSPLLLLLLLVVASVRSCCSLGATLGQNANVSSLHWFTSLPCFVFLWIVCVLFYCYYYYFAYILIFLPLAWQLRLSFGPVREWVNGIVRVCVCVRTRAIALSGSHVNFCLHFPHWWHHWWQIFFSLFHSLLSGQTF